jgi:hypothetical protein
VSASNLETLALLPPSEKLFSVSINARASSHTKIRKGTVSEPAMFPFESN